MSPILRWALLTLATYRPIRFIAFDDFPPMIRIRERLITILGGDDVGQWGKLITCPWCLSIYIVTIICLIDYYRPIPLPLILAGASMTVIGFLGSRDN